MADLNFKSLLDAIQRQESSRDPVHDGPTRDLNDLVSPTGARGVMQVKIPTAMKPGYEKSGAKNIFDVAKEMGFGTFDQTEEAAIELLDTPEINKEFASRYMEALLVEFDGNVDQAVAAYTAGVGAVKRGGRKYDNLPHNDDRKYVDSVRQYYNQSTGDNYPVTMSPRPQMRPKGLLN
tara:strand:+ start:218 stop:751 length:534 start_codon:yes stop_codon:yes gene_type:complete